MSLRLVVGAARELAGHVGAELGTSGWRTLHKEDILAFAGLTGDRHWVHTDAGRAREAGLEDVLAHGFLTLSLVTALADECYTISGATRWVNYGLDRIRFTAPVFPGRRLRLRVTLEALDIRERGARLDLGCLLEQDGDHPPALAARWIVLVEE